MLLINISRSPLGRRKGCSKYTSGFSEQFKKREKLTKVKKMSGWQMWKSWEKQQILCCLQGKKNFSVNLAWRGGTSRGEKDGGPSGQKRAGSCWIPQGWGSVPSWTRKRRKHPNTTTAIAITGQYFFRPLLTTFFSKLSALWAIFAGVQPGFGRLAPTCFQRTPGCGSAAWLRVAG